MYAIPRDIAFGASFCPNQETTRAANFRNGRERFHGKNRYVYCMRSIAYSEYEYIICGLDNYLLAWFDLEFLVCRT